MLHIIALHGMSCPLEECWLENTISDLKKLGIKEFIVPHFPVLEKITLEKWDDILAKYSKKFNQHTVVIAHSLSTLFIVKFLFKHKLSVNALISVAGGYGDKVEGELSYLSSFIPNDKEFDYLKKNVANRFHIFSNDDTIWSQEHIAAYNNKVYPVQIQTFGCGHYGRSSKVKEIPQIAEIVKSILT